MQRAQARLNKLPDNRALVRFLFLLCLQSGVGEFEAIVKSYEVQLRCISGQAPSNFGVTHPFLFERSLARRYKCRSLGKRDGQAATYGTAGTEPCPAFSGANNAPAGDLVALWISFA